MSEFCLANIVERIAAAFPDRVAIESAAAKLTYREFLDRSRRLANFLRSQGLGRVVERSTLQNWESGQDHVALYLHNGPAYLEGLMGAWLSRTAAFNVNYRYVGDELVYLLTDAGAKAVVYHARFAPTLAAALSKLPARPLLIQVADESGLDLLPGAFDYEALLAQSTADKPDCTPSGDDLYLLYTGGTTGMPKGVLWRQEDIFFSAMGGMLPTGETLKSLDGLVRLAEGVGPALRALPCPPLMHGAAQWMACNALSFGGTVVFPTQPSRLDAGDILRTVATRGVTFLLLVGDAFAAPLAAEMDRAPYDLASLRVIASGGAILSPQHKAALQRHVPGALVRDTIGSSESGAQGVAVDEDRFQMNELSAVADHALGRVLRPGDDETGWLVRKGYIPLGYLNDAEKTARAFVMIDGVRWSVPGDHARHEPDGTIRVFGRGSQCINSGGEKIYPEEVERALKAHPQVADALVVGLAHPTWGERVTAVVQPRGAAAPSLEELHTVLLHLAKYKFPKAVVHVAEVRRSPSGKPDYRWAREVALQTLESGNRP